MEAAPEFLWDLSGKLFCPTTQEGVDALLWDLVEFYHQVARAVPTRQINDDNMTVSDWATEVPADVALKTVKYHSVLADLSGSNFALYGDHILVAGSSITQLKNAVDSWATMSSFVGSDGSTSITPATISSGHSGASFFITDPETGDFLSPAALSMLGWNLDIWLGDLADGAGGDGNLNIVSA
jgi:hypothetical protein